jgi:hypothetical protein
MRDDKFSIALKVCEEKFDTINSSEGNDLLFQCD